MTNAVILGICIHILLLIYSLDNCLLSKLNLISFKTIDKSEYFHIFKILSHFNLFIQSVFHLIHIYTGQHSKK